MDIFIALGAWVSYALTLVGYLGILWKAFQTGWVWLVASILFPPSILVFLVKHKEVMKPWGLLLGFGFLGFIVFYFLTIQLAAKKETPPLTIEPVTFGVKSVAAGDQPELPPETPGNEYAIEVTTAENAYAVVFGFNSGGGFTPISDVTPIVANVGTKIQRKGNAFKYHFSQKGHGLVPGGPIYVVVTPSQAALEAFAQRPNYHEVMRHGMGIATGEDEADRPRKK